MPKIITDILVYIVLKEEFEYIYDSIDIDLVPMELKDDPLIVYTATINSGLPYLLFSG